jgi:hypothetical protein
MEMIGHDHKNIDHFFRAHFCRTQPFFAGNLAKLVEANLPVDHVSEQAFSIVSAEGQEVPTRTGIVMFWEAERPTVAEGA